MRYSEFLSDKAIHAFDAGFTPDESKYPTEMMPHQVVSTTWALKRGKAALFHDTGLGKTIQQLTWAKLVNEKTGQPVIIVAPLAVTKQTVREGEKFGIACSIANFQDDVESGVYVTNYEKLHLFDGDKFSGVVLDESSILKGMMGKIRKQITSMFSKTPYRLSCTATPSPNDYMELGTQSEFLGIMSQVEMLAMFFIHDGSDTSKWRLKGHGKRKFFEWLSTWSMFLSSPEQLGFDGSMYKLHPIEYHSHIIETTPDGSLFVEPAQSLIERNRARKSTIVQRCKKAAEIANEMTDPCVIWCNLNDESRLLAELCNDSVEVTGSDTDDHKTQSVIDFADGKIKVLISKPKITGFGINWQTSHNCIFVGLSDSWESFYQAIRRQWRFGQTETVHCHIVSADVEGAVVENIRRKDAQHRELKSEMDNLFSGYMQKQIFGATIEKTDYCPCVEMIIPRWL